MLFYRLTIIFLLLLTVACTSVADKEKSVLAPERGAILGLSVDKISITDISPLNTFFDAAAILTPKDALVNWIHQNIQSNGGQDKLIITINSAVLQKVPCELYHEKYKATYDITFRIYKDKIDGAEINIFAENYRLFSDNVSKNKRHAILREQLGELNKLLEVELLEKAKIYFADYMTKPSTINK